MRVYTVCLWGREWRQKIAGKQNPGFCGGIKYEVKKKRLTNVGIGDILTKELDKTNQI